MNSDTYELCIDLFPESFIDPCPGLSPYLKPETLCVFCDGPMPDKPSRILRGLIGAARRGAQPDQNRLFMNPYALVVPTSRSADTCARHRFECREMVAGDNWPNIIDFGKVESRVRGMEVVLNNICNDVDCRGARKAYIFWEKIVVAVQKSGIAKAMGIGAQLNGSHSLLPG